MDVSGKEFTQQMLSNLLALQRTIMDIETTVRNEATKAGIQANLGFLKADDTNVKTLQSTLQQMGLQDKGPDDTLKTYLDTTRQIMGMNVPPRTKLTTYLFLLDRSRTLTAVLSRAALMNGDKALWEKLAIVHLNDWWKHAVLMTALASVFADAMGGAGGGGGPSIGMR